MNRESETKEKIKEARKAERREERGCSERIWYQNSRTRCLGPRRNAAVAMVTSASETLSREYMHIRTSSEIGFNTLRPLRWVLLDLPSAVICGCMTPHIFQSRESDSLVFAFLLPLPLFLFLSIFSNSRFSWRFDYSDMLYLPNIKNNKKWLKFS